MFYQDKQTKAYCGRHFGKRDKQVGGYHLILGGLLHRDTDNVGKPPAGAQHNANYRDDCLFLWLPETMLMHRWPIFLFSSKKISQRRKKIERKLNILRSLVSGLAFLMKVVGVCLCFYAFPLNVAGKWEKRGRRHSLLT